MKNPGIYLNDIGKVFRGKSRLGVLGYYDFKYNSIVINRRITKVSYKNLIYIINHEFIHAILHRLHLYKSREDFDNLPRRNIYITGKGEIYDPIRI